MVCGALLKKGLSILIQVLLGLLLHDHSVVEEATVDCCA